jgi:hypothetical protein
VRKSLKTKQVKRDAAPARKPDQWSARKAKALRAYRFAGRATNCSK